MRTPRHVHIHMPPTDSRTHTDTCIHTHTETHAYTHVHMRAHTHAEPARGKVKGELSVSLLKR